ncbi:hypothetical protein PP175_25530 (plasmid) [Aneurinibacillus sp. Ricciae_BoGa-3]|uniref:hypothetical protein n=1 Tax=Aneurinibacillus sp. Ricciae_BoGa-3 TaxID=3022697 RepID=UPI00233FCCB5|nr:hypothetical protein [Aneurinibacillus sp. Ricciae_BoGa-3]WCK57432.1 hypothetical protein PP175_25530 [Aneurinibacillus sp. Ricciae_BoGa-3]
MNQFVTMFREKENLELRDIIQWKEKGTSRYSTRYLIYKKENGHIGLLDVQSAVSSGLDFCKIEDLEDYLLKLEVGHNKIIVTPSSEWVVYVP